MSSCSPARKAPRQLGRTEDHLVVHGVAPSLELLDEPRPTRRTCRRRTTRRNRRTTIARGCSRRAGRVSWRVALIKGHISRSRPSFHSSMKPQAASGAARWAWWIDNACDHAARRLSHSGVIRAIHCRWSTPRSAGSASVGQLFEVREMTGADLGHLTAFLQAVVREGPNHLEHPEPGRGTVRGHRRHERVLHQTRRACPGRRGRRHTLLRPR